jgi:hypothetical protein
MILNKTYYQALLNKFETVRIYSNGFKNNTIRLTVKMIIKHCQEKKPIHINFQDSKETITEIGKHLFIEIANEIYLNHYDLPDNYKIGDKLKRIKDNQYYEITRAENHNYALIQIMRKTKNEISPTVIPGINYDALAKGFVKIDSGVSEKTIKNYFDFFEDLNNEKNEFPKTRFEQKSVFIAKKTLWDDLSEKNKIPSVYLPNPREESNSLETRSIPALSDCMVYFTPKYEVCYQNILLKGKKIKTLVVFDTEADKIEQMLHDKARWGFNLIIISNSDYPEKNTAIHCWNWFKEEIEIVNAL